MKRPWNHVVLLIAFLIAACCTSPALAETGPTLLLAEKLVKSRISAAVF